MRILFETERFNDSDIDSKLLDVLFAIKSEVIKRTIHLKDEIDSVDGEIVIVFTNSDGGFRFIFMEEPLMNKVNEVLKDIKFGYFVKQMMSAKKN